jgi:hypothetical protein
MPLIYGEGQKNALARLQKEIKVSSGEERNEVAQNQNQATQSYYGPVFYGHISGRYMVLGTYVTGDTVNFSFGEGSNTR